LFEIIFYRLPDGTAPVEQFLDSLNVKMRNKAVDSLTLLEEFGNQLREPHSKHLGDGLFELRIKFASDITRIFYFFYSGQPNCTDQWFHKEIPKNAKGRYGTGKKIQSGLRKEPIR